MSANSEPDSDLRLAPTRRRWSTLTYRLAMLIAGLLAISAIMTTTFAVRSVQDALYSEVSQSMINVHSSVESTIDLEYNSVVAFRQAELEARRDGLRDVASPLATTLDQFRSMSDAGEITVAQAQKASLQLLKDVRFANEDYFFTYDRSMTAISHPDAKFQGRNLVDLQDADGKYVLRELRDVALNEGSGYVDYKWVRLNETDSVPKIGFVFHYEPWDWIIGTGVYVDDIDAAAAARIEAIKSELASSLSQVSFSEDSMFFILDEQGQLIVSPDGATELDGFAATPDGQQVTAALSTTAPTPGKPLVETTVAATMRDGVSEDWVMQTSTIPGLGWILVSAVPQAELSGPGRSIAIQQLLMSLAILVLGLGAGLLLSRRLVRPVEDITKAAVDLSNDSFDPQSLDRAAKRSDEVGELARTFQRMGAELVTRERKLREQVAKLSVVIDRTRLAESVDEITESEHFQRIKAQADELRKNKPRKE
ncbi:MAG: cache domain-containing protein [Candidatus Nanopelagicales bacterium]|nr:cache domain-containing protein [Candidatus Nanopelagicales bacterium]